MSSHKHDFKKTQVTFIEYDDVNFNRLANDRTYFGEGNSKNRKLEYTFQYCTGCNLRLLNGKPILTRDILEDELEKLVTQAKKGNYISTQEITVQHSDFETLEKIIKAAIGFGKLKDSSKPIS
ncbi:MAG: hypothetical protein NWE92_05760 [Candidatus Bathyarchaeota archaeon]|nr:hypothetical protein [Candidatus Bathyarchaeota archaeon]